MGTVILVLLALALITAGYVWLSFTLARYQAIRDCKKVMPLLGGLAKLIVWEPNEGLVLLKYKQVSEVINTPGGGMRFIFPIRGEELRARIPLTLRLVTWEDQSVLTRESIQVRMKVAVWWRVADLHKYAFIIDSGVHVEDQHHEIGVLEAAEVWLKTLTESTLRTLASHASVALLISSKATDYLHVQANGPGNPAHTTASVIGSPDSLAAELQDDLARKATDYGLEIQRVEIQELGLSHDIQQAIDRVWKASLLPAQTEQEARARQIELQAVASVLGVDAVAMNEVMKNFKGSSFFSVPAFLDSLLGPLAQRASKNPQALSASIRPELPGDSSGNKE